MPYKCAVPGCGDTTSPRHRFPRPDIWLEMFNLWINVIQNPILNSLLPASVYSSHRVCHRHFLDKDITRNMRLFKTAVPALYLPAPHIGGNSMELDTQASSSAEVIQVEVDGPSTPVRLLIQNKGDYGSRLKQNGILRAINVNREKHLTPKKKQLYREVKKLKKEIYRCHKKKLSFRRRLHMAENASKTLFIDMYEKLDPIVVNFFKCQLRNASKNSKGCRFSFDDKIMALSLYKQSGKGYRWLSKLFALPSRKTMMALLNKIPLKVGINKALFSHLEDTVKLLKQRDHNCVLIFDEMQLQANFHFNKNMHRAEGFEDTGYDQTQRVADHILVFMIRGVFKKWKQPVAYSFCEGTTKTAVLLRTIKDIIRALHLTGLNILACVCDQGSTNVAAINSLVNATRAEYVKRGEEMRDRFFEIDGKKVIPLYDPPHLLKGIRNNFLTKNIQYRDDNNQMCVAKWDHIIKAYMIDAQVGHLRIMKKLTDFHVIPKKIKKMKVSYCAQVFSAQVASGLMRMSMDMSKSLDGTITLEKEAKDTAHLLYFFDNLFDSVNGGARFPHKGKRLRAAVTKQSRHVEFWRESIQKLKNMKYETNNKNIAVPLSLKNWILTLEGFIQLHVIIQDLGLPYFLPRVFNQDPLENFFGQIRQHGGRNINPTCFEFSHYFKAMLVNNFVSVHSLGSNCERDEAGHLLLTLKTFIQQDVFQLDNSEVVVPLELPENLTVERDIDDAAIGFVSGFITKCFLAKFGDCAACKKNMTGDPTSKPHHSLTVLREFREQQALIYSDELFFQKLKEIYHVILRILPKVCFKDHFDKMIVATVKHHFTFNFLHKCEKHSVDLVSDYIISKFSTLIIYNYFNSLNNVLKGKDTRIDRNDTIAKYCEEKYLKSRKCH